MRANNSAVDLNGLLLVELVLAVLTIVHLVSLLDRGGTPVNDALLLEVKVSRLVLGSEVLDVEFQPSKLDRVASS